MYTYSTVHAWDMAGPFFIFFKSGRLEKERIRKGEKARAHSLCISYFLYVPTLYPMRRVNRLKQQFTLVNTHKKT